MEDAVYYSGQILSLEIPFLAYLQISEDQLCFWLEVCEIGNPVN